MATNDLLSDGTISWLGGMDTSRSATDIDVSQYCKATNVIVPESGGGVVARFGIHCVSLSFDHKDTENLYRTGSFQAEGWFESNGRIHLIVVMSGYVFRLTENGKKRYRVALLNRNNRNININSSCWVVEIPNGCIVNDGVTNGLIVTENTQRRSDPDKGEFGIGQMGVYVQNRTFMVDQSGRQILAGDFLRPTFNTREGTNIFGFTCPDANEVITAIGKQKSMLDYAEGGNLAWSSTRDMYSADVRGTRSDWQVLGTRVGKTTETIPSMSAASPYSFEAFNTNIYFRTKSGSIGDIKQSEYQFANTDGGSDQSIEAAYFLQNDTDWMLDRCYTRSCNARLFTTVAPEVSESGQVFWNGILSMRPAAVYANRPTLPRRYESVFTGVRPWGLTATHPTGNRDQLFIHSHDIDGVNRMYLMDEDTNYDISPDGKTKEIEGFIETRAYNHQNEFLPKDIVKRFYRLSRIDREININLFCRPGDFGEWSAMSNQTHGVLRNKFDDDGWFIPINHKPQSRDFVILPTEKFPKCHSLGSKCLSVQYRIEFTGPICLDSFAVTATLAAFDQTTSDNKREAVRLIYSYRPNYYYNIAFQPPITDG